MPPLMSGNMSEENAKKSYIAGLKKFKNREFQKSIAFFSQAITQGMPDDDIYLYRSICRTQINDLTGALSDLDHLIQSYPDRPEFRFRKGYVLYKLERFSDAIHEFSAIPDDENQFLIRWHYSCICFYKNGQYDSAMQASEKALEYFSTIPKIWFNAGVVLSAMHREDQALLAFQVAHKLEPQLSEAVRTIIE